MEYKLNLSNTENKDLVSYCNLNDLRISEVVKKSYLEGFNIERYGLLNLGGNQEKQVEKEVIVEKRVEIPVEVLKEVIKIEYVEVEKPVETIIEKVIEVVKEVPVEKIIYITNQEETDLKIFQKEQEILEITQKFSTKMEELANIFQKEKNELLLKIQQLESREPEIKEIIREVEVFKETSDEGLRPKLDALQTTVQKLKQDNIDKDRKIKEYEKTIEEIQKFQQDKRAAFLKGSNLDNPLYK
jgi:DNA repair exonuclease SbcCD ATPase subunit